MFYKLGQYRDKWCHEVKLDKSKVLIFNKTGRLYTTSCTYNGRKLGYIIENKYLGLTLCTSGIFPPALSELYKKAL